MQHPFTQCAGLIVALAIGTGCAGNPPKVVSGTRVETVAMSQISSASTRAGDVEQARVLHDVVATDGKTVVIPAGSIVTLSVTQIAGAPGRGEKGALAMSAKSVEIGGKSYPLEGSATNYQYEMKPHDIGVNEVAKTGVGAVVGGLVGHAVAGDAGTVVGAVGGGVVGGEIAAHDLDRDLVVHRGGTITLTLTGDFAPH